MARKYLLPGADQTRCPDCGSEMSSAKPGRYEATQHQWFRTCRNLQFCGLTTITTEPPPGFAAQQQPPTFALPVSLPFDGGEQ